MMVARKVIAVVHYSTRHHCSDSERATYSKGASTLRCPSKDCTLEHAAGASKLEHTVLRKTKLSKVEQQGC